MKKGIAILLVTASIFLLTACSKELKASGCKVIRDEDNKYVTYQTICDNCGYEYGDPNTTSVTDKLFYSVNCTRCGEIIYVSLERG